MALIRRAHLIVGVLGLITFVITGQVMARHVPDVHTLSAEVRLMYVSRHIYLLGAALVNLVLGLYLQLNPRSWRSFFGVIALFAGVVTHFAGTITRKN